MSKHIDPSRRDDGMPDPLVNAASHASPADRRLHRGVGP